MQMKEVFSHVDTSDHQNGKSDRHGAGHARFCSGSSAAARRPDVVRIFYFNPDIIDLDASGAVAAEHTCICGKPGGIGGLWIPPRRVAARNRRDDLVGGGAYAMASMEGHRYRSKQKTTRNHVSPASWAGRIHP